VTTAFTDGMLADEATLPPTHPASVLVGGKALTPEESTNYTIGAVFHASNADITLDYFRIALDDRIARSSQRKITKDQRDILKAAGVEDADNFSQVRFYTNDFDTITQGIDLVVTWPVEMFGGETDFSFAGNWTETSVEERNPEVIDDKRVTQLEKNLPRVRFTLAANHTNGPWTLLARLRYYGKFTEFATDDAAAHLDADAKSMVDVQGSYAFSDSLTLIGGADNVFDEYPSKHTCCGGNVSGQIYSETSPYGFNGGYYYLKGVWNF
ncbi:MAG: TonB-dependent receptor domain-containing protein, partial [Pseudomonadales bacterium]